MKQLRATTHQALRAIMVSVLKKFILEWMKEGARQKF
jgi:hypothetical protein